MEVPLSILQSLALPRNGHPAHAVRRTQCIAYTSPLKKTGYILRGATSKEEEEQQKRHGMDGAAKSLVEEYARLELEAQKKEPATDLRT